MFSTIFADNLKLANYYKKFFKTLFPYLTLSKIYEEANMYDKNLLLSFVKETHNVYIIKILSVVYYIYRKFIKTILQKLNIHQKIVKFLFFR